MKSALPALIGVIHLPPLAGAPGGEGVRPSDLLARAGALAVKEAVILERAGFGGVIIENFGDTPFFAEAVPPETVASLSVIAAAVRESISIPVGINVLRNDARSALGIAAATGCDFIRVNVLSGLAATDQGLIQGRAAELLRERARLGVERQVLILADVHVKHAKTLSSDDIELGVEELLGRARADAVIVSGSTTGRAADPQLLARAARAARAAGKPFFTGSGATLGNLGATRACGAGVIVSSALRRGGRPGAALDPARARAFARAFRRSAGPVAKVPRKPG